MTPQQMLDKAHEDFQTVAELAQGWKARALAAEAERDALREALEPFARAAEDCGVLDDLRDGKVKPADIIWEGAVAAAITYGDVARALKEAPDV